MKGRSDKSLCSPPQEQITAVKFLPSSSSSGNDEHLVAAASFDCSVRVYDFKKNVVQLKHDTDMPVLALAPMGPTSLCFGGMKRNVCMKEVEDGKEGQPATCIGFHDDTISAVEYNKLRNLIVTGGWDSSVRLWDHRKNSGNRCVGNISTEGQVLNMSVKENIAAVGLAGGTIGIWDLRNFSEPLKILQVKESLNLQCIAVFSDMTRIVYGTVEGRASIECVGERSSKLEFLFKPHVDKAMGISHPVNAVSCIEGSSRFLMGGSDGKLRLWDPDTRKLVADFTSYPNEISAVDTSVSGKYAAVACSYTNDRELENNQEIPPPSLYIRNISEYVTKLQWLAYLEFSHSRDEVHELSWESIPEKLPLSQKLWKMIQNGGIPHSLRPQLWCRLSPTLEKKSNLTNLPYWKVVKESTANEYFSYAKHIEKDLTRILPGNGCFTKSDSPGIPRLRRVLRALSWLYPDVGYCQGFGTVVAHLLLLLEEEDCFWIMCTIIEDIVPASYFTNDFIGIRTDSLVLASLVAEYFPEVDSLLKEHDIELGLIVFTWFLTLFASVVHVKILLRIWDMLFAEGCSFLFKVMLALIKFKVKGLLELKNSAEIFNFLSDLPSEVDDFDSLEISEFEGINANRIDQERKKCASQVVSDGSVFSSKCRRVKKRDCRKLEKAKSSSNVLKTIFGENGGPEDLKTKNIRQTEIMVELHDSITQIGRHFISNDQNFIKVSLEPDFTKESHAKDFERFTQGYNMNGFKRAKALVDFERRDDDELGFRKNDIITVINYKDEHCWIGDLNGLRGWFPAKCVTLLDERSKLYSAAGDDSVTEGIADLIRGSLCPCLKRIFEYGMKRPNTLVGPVHPYMFIEEVALKEIERDFKSVYSRLVLCKTYRLDEDGKVLSPEELLYRSVELVNRSHDKVQMDVKLRSLICLGLNEQVLHLWIEMLCSCSEIVNKWYHPWSIMNSPGWIGLKCELRILSQFSFNLSVNWELKAQKEEKLDVKSGVQDMLVKHHLFSWNL